MKSTALHHPLTICIDCRMADMSGIGVYIRNLVPLCMQALPHVSFRLITSGSLPFPLPNNAVSVHASSRIYSLREQLELPLLIKGTRGLWAPHYAFPLAAPIPVLVTVHDLAHLALPEIFSPIQRAYARLLFTGVRLRARAILFNSQFTKREFYKHVGSPSCLTTVTPLGIAHEWFQNYPVENIFSFPYFLAVGNLKPHKNLLSLCHAFTNIADEIPHHLILAGRKEGFINGMDGKSIESLLPGRIHCTGKITFNRLRCITRGATALVFPSLYEGFGFPPLEALACGTPVIASDIPPIRETCGDIVDYIDPYSQENICNALLRAVHTVTTMDRKELMHRQARQFIWEKTRESTTKVLQQVFLQ